MTRQVRLDDDVAAFVESLSEGLSLSGSTNRILRDLAAGGVDQGHDDQDGARSPRIVPGRSGRRDAPIDHPTTSRPLGATTERLVEAIGPEPSALVASPGAGDLSASIDHERSPDASGTTRARRAKRERRRPLCKHPLELRVGRRCGLCGSTFIR